MPGASDRRIVIGVGNPDRGDDGAGHAVVRLLRDALPGGIEVAEENGEATALIARIAEVDEAYLVDASVSGASPGTVRRFDAVDAPLPYGKSGASTHGFGLAEAIELARTLGQLPRSCVVYAIEGVCFDAGASLTPPVADAVAHVARRMYDEIVAGAESRNHA